MWRTGRSRGKVTGAFLSLEAINESGDAFMACVLPDVMPGNENIR
jgi:hypothetical protein